MVAHPVILGDWGGTRLRLWSRLGGITVASSEASGLLVAQESPADVLRAALDRLGVIGQPRRIVLCGMAGARDGLAEAGYVPCPGGVDEWIGAALATSLDAIPITILPGFSHCDRQGRPDVMRGEEAQVFGALARQQAGDRSAVEIVLPGTHSKWVRVEDGRIAHFATCPTGELHARLLGSSLAPREPHEDDRGHADGFSAGIDRARDGRPLMASLFEARAAQLLDRRSGDWSRGFLSGLLIGGEIAAMATSPARKVAPLLVGSADLVGLYRTAFAKFGLDCRTADGESCALYGLEIAHAQLG
jgi:2-dehydro-3-deoxygalactonokinase